MNDETTDKTPSLSETVDEKTKESFLTSTDL